MSEDELAGIGYRLVKAHTPIQFDWRRRFGFPSAKVEEEVPVKMMAVAPPSEEPIGTVAAGGRRRHIGKTEVPIRGGSLLVFRYENGDRAIRCDDDSLKRKVSEVCRLHHGRWAPYPKFWLVSLEACRSIIEQLGGSTTVAKTETPAQATHSPAETQAASIPIRSADNNQQSPTPAGDHSAVLQTGRGAIRFAALADGRHTVKCDPDPSLIEIVRSSCSGIGRWNPRYKNWLIGPQDIAAVTATIRQKASAMS